MSGGRTEAHSVKRRADLALADDFLRGAVKRTTERLRSGKQTAAEELGRWEEWRERGRQIRLHVIAHLDYYLHAFAENARRNGAFVHFADDGAEAVRIALDIAARRGAKTAVKSKSMVTEEIHLNEAFGAAGVDTVETDLGEHIIQLAGELPSHIIIPAIHKNREQVAELLSADAGAALPPDTAALAGYVRKKLRDRFLSADLGITGCNFAVAETGSVVLFENEGNARMVSTLPKTQITFMGMERIVPAWSDLEVMATLLPRAATGQKLTVYMSGISGPRRAGDKDGPEQLHIIIVDNGRSRQLGDPVFQELLHCIRCGACLNACPVYRHIGGHAYGGTYSGPIGAVLTPALADPAGWNDIADASSLCGACHEACPVKIPLHDMLVELRRRKAEAGRARPAEALAMKGYAAVMSRSSRYRKALKLARLALRPVSREGGIRARIGPLKTWNERRVFPALPRESFRERYRTLEAELRAGLAELDEAVRLRAEKRLRERLAARMGKRAARQERRDGPANDRAEGMAGPTSKDRVQKRAGARPGDPADARTDMNGQDDRAKGHMGDPADARPGKNGREGGEGHQADNGWLERLNAASRVKQEQWMNRIAEKLGRPRFFDPPQRPFRSAPDFWEQNELTVEEAIRLFTDNLRAAGGKTAEAGTMEEALARAADEIRRRKAQRVIAAGQPELAPLAEMLADVDVTVWNGDAAANRNCHDASADPCDDLLGSSSEADNALRGDAAEAERVLHSASIEADRVPDGPVAAAAAADIGIVIADCAVASTGSIAVTSSPAKGRSVSLLPPALLAIVPVSRLKTRLGEGFAEFDRTPPGQLPAGIHFISGPSRSADIENDLTIGVHGPGAVFAILLDDRSG